MKETHISLAHGNGGRFMRELIDDVFAHRLENPTLDTHADAVPLALGGGEVLVTTDGFTVQPIEFPGGDIGSLAVHGTCNDLAVAGAKPLYLSLNAFIEEGVEIALLDRVIESLGNTARDTGVQVAAGDTKILPRGEGSGIYLATTGIGLRTPGCEIGLAQIRDGDTVLVSGPVGDHGVAVMLAREQFGLRGALRSDAGNVLPLTTCLLDIPGLRFMRDPTRGGIATVANEISRVCAMEVRLAQPAIPVRESVQSVCEMLGYDPLYLACEGRVVAVVASAAAEAALAAWRALPQGKDAAIIGAVRAGAGRVILETELGGERLLDELEDDPLPRIC